jgi:DNA-binding IclR family transcriptional regulator
MPNGSSESVISRIVRIIDAFDRDRAALPLGTLARRADLPLTTTHRLVSELSKHGLLERGPNREIRLGIRLWELSSRGSTIMLLREAALPHLEELNSWLKVHINLSILDADSILFLERLSYSGSIPVARVGERFPIHACSPGLALLAHAAPDYQDRILLPPLKQVTEMTITDPMLIRKHFAEIKERGYAIVPGVGVSEWTGIAVPIARCGSTPVAAVSAIYPRGHEEELKAVAALKRTAVNIARCLDPSSTGQHFHSSELALTAPGPCGSVGLSRCRAQDQGCES